jgi:hypothetical protein
LETKEKTLFTSGQQLILIGVSILLISVFTLVALEWKESPVKKTVSGQAIIHLLQTQTTVVDGKFFLSSTITFLKVHSKQTTTEQVLIPEEQFTSGLLTKLLFKNDTDSLYFLPDVDLQYLKDDTKRLMISKIKTSSPGI